MAVRTNYAVRPQPVIAAAPWSYQAATGETYTRTVITNAADGPMLPNGHVLTSYLRRTVTAPKSGPTGNTGQYYRSNVGDFIGLAGDVVTSSVYVRSSEAVTGTFSFQVRSGATTVTVLSTTYDLEPNVWTRVTSTVTASGNYDGFQSWAVIPAAHVAAAGSTFDMTGVLTEKASELLAYFDGGCPPRADQVSLYTSTWLAEPMNSPSVETSSPAVSVNGNVAGKVAAAMMVQPVIERSFDRAEADLRPFEVTHVRADDAPIYRGYPKATPAWVRVKPVLSAEGQIIGSNRPRPGEVVLDSDVRFIAGEDYFDETTGIWRSAVSNRQNYYMTGQNLVTTPVLEESTYVSGREVITNSSFRVSDGTSFLCQFNDGLDNYTSMTVSMVIAPNPQTGSYPVLEWHHPMISPTAATRLALWLGDKMDYYWGGTGGSVDQVVPLNKTRPLFVTVTIDGPKISVTISYSPRHQYTTSKVSPLGVTSQWMRMRVGGSDVAIPATSESDFNIFEFNLWDRALSSTEVTLLNATYASIYGVASEWR